MLMKPNSKYYRTVSLGFPGCATTLSQLDKIKWHRGQNDKIWFLRSLQVWLNVGDMLQRSVSSWGQLFTVSTQSRIWHQGDKSIC